MIPIITLTVKTMDMILEKHFYKLVTLILVIVIGYRLPELIQILKA